MKPDGRKARPVVTNWAAIPSEDVRPGVSRRAIGTPDALLVMNTLSPGMELAPHRHDTADQIAYIVSGRAVYHVGDVHHEVEPGSVLLIPAGEEHYIEPIGEEPVLNLDVFGPARPDLLHLLSWMMPSPDVDTVSDSPQQLDTMAHALAPVAKSELMLGME